MKTIFILLLTSISLFAQNQPRDQNIVAGEYFINQDPGEGNGTPLSSTYGFATADVTINSVPINNVVYIRFKSSNGKWGPLRSIKNKYPIHASGSLIQAGEYFVNSDPGIGNANKFNIDYSGNINLSSINANRNDKIFLRSKDSYGRWSDAVCVNYRYKNLIGAEYKLKYVGGSSSAWQKLNMQDQTSPSAFFSAISDSITNQSTVDTLFIHFQSEDFIWGTVSKYAWKDIISGVREIDNNIPKEFFLYQNYPNPFNPSTKIRFEIPKTSFVKLIVYDILGREIAVLINKEMKPGSYETIFNARGIASGVYFYRIETGSFSQTKKFVLLK
ncbi:MAG: T9SS type A sorting domain-containing protein [Bacteroidetes bacterium]|nr:T9SS type A sorting domain-containing protein [Bacteroidota bacterium]